MILIVCFVINIEMKEELYCYTVEVSQAYSQSSYYIISTDFSDR